MATLSVSSALFAASPLISVSLTISVTAPFLIRSRYLEPPPLSLLVPEFFAFSLSSCDIVRHLYEGIQSDCAYSDLTGFDDALSVAVFFVVEDDEEVFGSPDKGLMLARGPPGA